MYLIELPKIHLLLSTHGLHKVMEGQHVSAHVVPLRIVQPVLRLLRLKVPFGHFVLVLLRAGVHGVGQVFPLRTFAVYFEGSLFGGF